MSSGQKFALGSVRNLSEVRKKVFENQLSEITRPKFLRPNFFASNVLRIIPRLRILERNEPSRNYKSPLSVLGPVYMEVG